MWTGNTDYINDADQWQFYTKVVTDYIDLHDTQDPNGIAEGYGGIFDGSATYNERGEFPIEAGDGIGSQYQAFVAYAAMLEARGELSEAAVWQEKAAQLPHGVQPQATRHDRVFGEVAVKKPKVRPDIELGTQQPFAVHPTVLRDFRDSIDHQHIAGWKTCGF